MLATKNPARGLSIFLMVAGALLLAGCMASGPRALIDGDRALRDGNPTRAVQSLKRATELLPEEPRAWNLLGLAYHRTGQPQLAAQAYRKAMEFDRSNLVAVAHFNLGCLLLEQGNASAAADELRSFTMISNSVPGWVKLGQAQARLRQLLAAERSLATAVRLDPKSAEAYNDLGMVYLQQNRVRDALQYIHAALQVDPKYGPAILNLAVLAQQSASGRPAALQRCRDYLALQPRPAHYEAVAAFARQLEADLTPRSPGVPVSSNEPVRPAPVSPGSQTRTNALVTPVATNAPAIAAGNSLRVTPGSPGALALEIARQVTNVPSPSIERDRPAVAAGNAPMRVETTNRVPTAPVQPPVSNAPSRVAAATLSPPIPVTSPPAVKVTNPPTPVTVVAVTTLPPAHVASGPPAQAPGSISSSPPATVASPPLAQAPPPSEAVAPQTISEAPTPLERTSKPGLLTRLNPFRSKTERPPSSAQTIVVTNSLAASAPKPSAAPSVSRTFPRYAYVNPPAPAAGARADSERSVTAGVKAERAGNPRQALAEYRNAIAADPSYFDAQYSYAYLTQQLGDAKAALPLWETVLAVEPESINSRYNFALALKQTGYVEDAVAELDKILIAKPNEARAHLTLGNLYAQQLGDTRKAREHYMKVVELDPRNPQAPAIRFWLAANP